MSTRPPYSTVIDGHMMEVRVRRERGAPYQEPVFDLWTDKMIGTVTKHHPGRTYVEAIVWQGEEATGEPLAEWELPYQLRYDLDGAARLAVAQTRFPAAEPESEE